MPAYRAAIDETIAEYKRDGERAVPKPGSIVWAFGDGSGVRHGTLARKTEPWAGRPFMMFAWFSSGVIAKVLASKQNSGYKKAADSTLDRLLRMEL
jgi:hypothetical protein